MLNKEQAEHIADDILRQQSQQSVIEKNATIGAVPLFYRCPELNRLSPIERKNVMQQAKSAMWRGHWLATIASLAWVGFFTGFLFLILTPEQRSVSFFYWLFLLYLPPAVLYISLLRLHVKYLAIKQGK
jgi:hypothetical protein